MSDLPKNAPGLEVDPIEPVEDEPAEQACRLRWPTPATDNAQVQGDDPDTA